MPTRPALLLALTLGLLAGCKGQSPTEAAADTPPQIPVEVAQASRAQMLARYGGTATLEAEADAEVVAREAGVVVRVLVEEGDAVKEGQLLAVLDGRQLRLESAQALAQFSKSERDYKRQIELHQRGIVSAGAFEGMKYDLDNLRATHELAELRLSYTELRAPFAGVVSERHVKVGQNITQGDRTFRVTDATPLRAVVHVPERELSRLAVGQSAAAIMDALGGQAFDARVSLVSPSIDPATATFKVTLEVLDPKAVLKPGMFARVGIVFDRREGALQVPRVALVEADGTSSVFVVKDGKASHRTVTTGLTDGSQVELTSGVNEGESIVVVGQNGLKDGNAVRVVSLETRTAQR